MVREPPNDLLSDLGVHPHEIDTSIGPQTICDRGVFRPQGTENVAELIILQPFLAAAGLGLLPKGTESSDIALSVECSEQELLGDCPCLFG